MKLFVIDGTLPDLNDLSGLTQVPKRNEAPASSCSSSDLIIVDDILDEKPHVLGCGMLRNSR